MSVNARLRPNILTVKLTPEQLSLLRGGICSYAAFWARKRIDATEPGDQLVFGTLTDECEALYQRIYRVEEERITRPNRRIFDLT